ncbi:hypothetical protein HAX54_048676 [Datura stramonium]|uniref:Uncharacterized protein n=1 Tax=Datura stramonium TaxID=4076 RepID=A0ABS8SUP7_DATST|nr:hypothetical protein [Datura stramonium]
MVVELILTNQAHGWRRFGDFWEFGGEGKKEKERRWSLAVEQHCARRAAVAVVVVRDCCDGEEKREIEWWLEKKRMRWRWLFAREKKRREIYGGRRSGLIREEGEMRWGDAGLGSFGEFGGISVRQLVRFARINGEEMGLCDCGVATSGEERDVGVYDRSSDGGHWPEERKERVVGGGG